MTEQDSNFFTNKNGNSLDKKFENVFKNMNNIEYFDALVGYFRATGYFRIRKYIDKVPKVRILVGINVDNLVKHHYEQGLQFIGNAKQTKEEFFKDLQTDLEEADYKKEIEDNVIQFIDDIIEGKLEIKAHPSQKLHAKIYIFRPEEFNPHTMSRVVMGSSNLTEPGLGAGENYNYEFNVDLKDYRDVKFATDEFEALWKESKNILPSDVEKLKKVTHLNSEITPYELYIKLLIEYFNKRIDYDPSSIDLLLPSKYMPLAYQGEAAIEGYQMMMKHNGFFLSDVVGLGKTIIACIIAKKFIYENGYHTRILIVYPPAIKANWRDTINDFGITSNVAFITTGSLHKILDRENKDFEPPEAFDLIIVDEAHKFRNDNSGMYEKLRAICETGRQFPGENNDNIKKVMLLSATPMNNHPADIKNQLLLFQKPRNSTLPKVRNRNLLEFFKGIEKKYENIVDEIKALPAEAHSKMVLKLKDLKALFEIVRDTVIEPIVIRRTRNDILSNKDFAKDLKKQKIKFPTTSDPKKVSYVFNDKLSSLFYDTITILTRIDINDNKVEGLHYYRYRAIEFLKDKDYAKETYGDVRGISSRLSAIMKTMLVKRLESSTYAFKKSIKRFQKSTQNMINMFENDKVFVAPDIDVNKFLDENSEEKLEKKINEKGGRNQIYSANDFEDKFIPLLKKDKEFLDKLVKLWDELGDYDPKFDKFLEELKNTYLDKAINKTGKLVVFSESKETTIYLKKKLEENKVKKVLAIYADNRKENEAVIKENFDANYEGKFKNDYNIVLTTEVLAEGINLHRANVILNYDVPWNSTRLMQRIGRVNRIGTKADTIYVYNFYPTDHSENKIKLTATAIRKLQAFHTAFGEDSQIYSQLEEMGEAGLYSSKLKEERNETMEYLQELRDFKKKNKKWFEKIKEIKKKSRVYRYTANVVEKERDLDSATITYLKSENHPGVFYLVDKELQLLELNFTDAARIFKAEEQEGFIEKLTKEHYDQVNMAMDKFTTNQQQQVVSKAGKPNFSPTEKRALSYIRTLKKIAKEDPDIELLKNTENAISEGAIKRLPTAIDKYMKNKPIKVKQEYLKNFIFEVLKPFNILFVVEKPQENVLNTIKKPIIVLSESFKTK